jgi:hypothetical protein
MSNRREKDARNQALFREVNERALASERARREHADERTGEGSQ